MHLQNQGFQSSGQMQFTPVASSVSGIGTTVTYGLNPNPSIGASNTGILQSGSFAWPHTHWAGAPAHVHMQPSIFASQYGQLASGNYFGAVTHGMVQPSVDISETTSDIVISAYVANVNPNDIRLNITENSCTICASAWSGAGNLVMNRTVALPTSIHAEACDASLQSGVLEIRCPKADKALRAKATISPDVAQTQQI